MAAALNPANAPINARSPSSCQAVCTTLISPMNRQMAKQERSTISLRPRRSATLPQNGDTNAAMNGVTDASTPAQTSTAAGLRTPSTGRNSGMIGLSTVNPMFMPSWMPIITASVRRQWGETPASWLGSAATSAVSFGCATAFMRHAIGRPPPIVNPQPAPRDVVTCALQ